jgi:hypothetical protein
LGRGRRLSVDLQHSLSTRSSSSSVAAALACPPHSMSARPDTPEEDVAPLPMTVPGTLRFDVHQAAAACKANTSYVAFANLAGLDSNRSLFERDERKPGGAVERVCAWGVVVCVNMYLV